jgi:hypothetical protein
MFSFSWGWGEIDTLRNYAANDQSYQNRMTDETNYAFGETFAGDI